MEHTILEFYTQPSVMTSAGRYAPLFKELPNDIAELVRIIQHLVVYDIVASDFYGFTIPDKRLSEIHIRSIEKKLDSLLALDDRPLSVPRSVDKRLAGRCHHFMLFLIAILRAKNIPARARCGFGSYFNPPYFEDHWVCEYWNATEARWVLVDAQFDDVWRTQLKIEHDILDVPRDRFLVAGDAWVQCRTDEADPAKFGVEFVNLRGLWYIAGNLVRDLAALNKMEMLPWDVWGAQPRPDEALNDDQLAFFDRIAALMREPDRSFDELGRLYESDERLGVPAIVFNSLLNRQEIVSAMDNKQRMQDIFSELSKGNLEPFIEAMAEDMKWTWMGTGPWSHTFEGKDAVVNELLAAVKETLTEPFEVIAHRFIAEGEYVVIEHSGRNTTPDGRPYNNKYCWVCRFAEGKLRELREYMDTELVTETFGTEEES